MNFKLLENLIFFVIFFDHLRFYLMNCQIGSQLLSVSPFRSPFGKYSKKRIILKDT
jgi:hypothetical protein